MNGNFFQYFRCYLDKEMVQNGHIELQKWFPDFYVPTMTYPLRGTSPIVDFVKKNNEEMLRNITKSAEDRVQLPSVHLSRVEIPRNLVKAYSVDEVSKGQGEVSMFDVMKELFANFSKDDPVLIIKQAKLGYQKDKDFQRFLDTYERGSPLYYSSEFKSSENDVKEWTKGEKCCDLVTDAVYAAGFQADFVIVIGNKYGLNSAASRAIIKLAYHYCPLDKKNASILTLADGKKRLLESSKRNEFNDAVNVIKRILLRELPSHVIDAMKEVQSDLKNITCYPCEDFNSNNCSGLFLHHLSENIGVKLPKRIHVCAICFSLFKCGFHHSAKNCPLLLQSMNAFLSEKRFGTLKSLTDYLKGTNWPDTYLPCEMFNEGICSKKKHRNKQGSHDPSTRIHICEECFRNFHCGCFHPAKTLQRCDQDGQQIVIANEKCPSINC